MGLSYGIALERKGATANEYWGKYPAMIIDTQDPENRGRVRVTCPTVLDVVESDWAEPCFPPGLFYIPPVGTYVWVEFYQGDPNTPIWVGCFFPEGTPQLPSEASPPNIGNLLMYTWSTGTVGDISIQNKKGKTKLL